MTTASGRFGPAFQAELVELLRWRRDVRHFRGDPVPAALLETLLQTACLAPSVGLSQPWRFVSVEDPACREAVRENFRACNAEALAAQPDDHAARYARLKLAGLDQAPCHLAVFSLRDPPQGRGLGRRTMPATTAYSTVMAVHTLWLVARAAGLGLGWVSILDASAVSALLQAPADWELIGYLCLGYPEEEDDTPELQVLGWECRDPARAVLIRR